MLSLVPAAAPSAGFRQRTKTETGPLKKSSPVIKLPRVKTFNGTGNRSKSVSEQPESMRMEEETSGRTSEPAPELPVQPNAGSSSSNGTTPPIANNNPLPKPKKQKGMQFDAVYIEYKYVPCFRL